MDPRLRAMVDPKIHKLCVKARDYLDCVKAMKGDPISTPKVILPARTSFTGNETVLPSKKNKESPTGRSGKDQERRKFGFHVSPRWGAH